MEEEPLSNGDKGIRKLHLILNNSLTKSAAYLEYLKEDVESLSEDRDMGALESYRMQTAAVKSEYVLYGSPILLTNSVYRYFKGSKFQVDTFTVLGTYQDRGYGISLLDACIERLKSYSGSIARSFTPWSKNIAKRAGFNIKDCPIEYRESSFVMGLGVRPLSG